MFVVAALVVAVVLLPSSLNKEVPACSAEGRAAAAAPQWAAETITHAVARSNGRPRAGIPLLLLLLLFVNDAEYRVQASPWRWGFSIFLNFFCRRGRVDIFFF